MTLHLLYLFAAFSHDISILLNTKWMKANDSSLLKLPRQSNVGGLAWLDL